MAEVHQPKIEIFDVAAHTNTDPKGVRRAVERFRETDFGLYMARPTPGREQFHYIESWLLPSLGLRATDFWFNPGHERDQDVYLDVVTITRNGASWHATDLYLDIVVRRGRGLEVIDTDELLAATATGLLPQDQANGALDTAYVTVDALARHGYDLGAWLDTLGMRLSWLRQPERTAHPPIG